MIEAQIDQASAASNHMNVGVVTYVRGSIVDIRFEGRLPAIYTLLRTGHERHIALEVLMHLDVHHVRGVAMTPTQGLARGMAVEDTGGPLQVPVGKDLLKNNLYVFRLDCG